jgi:hypothetical protein
MPSEDQTHAALPGKQGKPARLPGGWQAIVIAAMSALLAMYWAKQGAAARRPEVGDAVSRVAEVEPQDLPAALGTVSAPPEQLEQFRKGEACHRRLAWVTLVRAPGQPAGRIRLQSGTYISPAYDLPDMPVRVAIPYPAPYPTGRGVIAVLGAETDAIVSLTPPWHVPARAGVNSREVSWTPASVCAGTGN